MRIVGGRLRGRSLAGPQSRDIRPTSDRLRESIFDILAHAYDAPSDETRALDVFAGVGAMGLEALSRGARCAMFIDSAAQALSAIRANVDRLDLSQAARTLRADACKLAPLKGELPFDLVFLDPPYGAGLAAPALTALGRGGWLAPEALIVVEDGRKADFAAPPGFTLLDDRTYGVARVLFLRFRPIPAF